MGLWDVFSSLDKFLESYLREGIWVMYFTSQQIVPIWNQDMRVMMRIIMLHSVSCRPLNNLTPCQL